MRFMLRVQTFQMSFVKLILPHEPRLAPKGASGLCVLTSHCNSNQHHCSCGCRCVLVRDAEIRYGSEAGIEIATMS